MKNFFIIAARLMVGSVFIFSGLIKANDPLGLSYKMLEYFEVWKIDGFDKIALSFSIILILIEIIIGVATIFGFGMQVLIWPLLAMISFFTFLTAYAVFSGKIKSCGCFGDCLPMTPIQSFAKDIFLLLLIIFLFIYRKQIKLNISKSGAIFFLIISFASSFLFIRYVLNHLPIKDCLPYKEGNNILEEMQLPKDAVMPVVEYTFIYEKNGIQKEYGLKNLPDSTWKFIDRKEKILVEGKNDKPRITNFILQPAYTSVVDTKKFTDSILSQDNAYYFMFVKDAESFNRKDSWFKYFAFLRGYCIEKNIPLYLVTSEASSAQKFFNSNPKFPALPILLCDFTEIKTAARSNPCIFKMHGPQILNKWGKGDFTELTKVINIISCY